MFRFTARAVAVATCVLLSGPGHAGEIYTDKSRGYSIEIPDRWVSVSPNVVTQINHAIALFVKQNVSYQACFVPAGHTSAELPRILVQFQPWDGEIPTYDVLEKTLKRDMPAAVNKVKKDTGAPLRSLEVGDVALDRKANRITMRMQASVPGDGMVQGLSIGMVGKDGIVFFHCYARAERFARTVPLFEVFADSFRFEPGRSFDESVATLTSESGRSGGRSSMFSWMGGFRRGTIGALIGGGIGLIAMAARRWRRRPA